MRNNILIIKYDQAGFEQFYSDELKKLKCDILDIDYLRSLSETSGISDFKLGRSIRIYFEREGIGDYAHIIVFDAVFMIPAIAYATRYRCKLHLWMWNTIEDYDVGRLQIAKEFADVWTFDKGDADNYGLHFSNQFYFPQSTEEVLNQNSKSVFFVGADKNRMKSLCEIADDLHSIGYQGDFYVLPDANKEYSKKEKRHLLKDRMDYESVIDRVCKCAAVLDLVKEEQVGITVRTLEAVFYKKKVITNNVAVKNTDLYQFGNIYILGKESVTLEDFLQKSFADYDQCILEKYTAKTWLKNICSGEESTVDNDKDVQYTDKQASKPIYYCCSIIIRMLLFLRDKFSQRP